MTEPNASPVRVLIIDDSSAVRRLLKDILAADPAIDVVGVAPDAVIALEKLKELKPDVITLDVEMPDVSGLELLARIRRLDAKIPVIMFSALTQRAAAITLEALALGATDYVTKPVQTGSREASAAHVREELIPKIKALGKNHSSPSTAALRRRPAAVCAPAVRGEPIEVVVIGSSTGGPNALADLFQALPADLPVPRGASHSKGPAQIPRGEGWRCAQGR
jgi:two-component system chemotaxis response regulator CheB